MKRLQSTAVALAIALIVGTVSTTTASAQTAPYCRPGESPQFRNGFVELKQAIGGTMGEPVDCGHTLENGDVLQETTTGLAFWRKATNVWTFTDGDRHWAVTPTGLAFWVGGEIDPPAYSVSSPAAVAAIPRPPAARASETEGPVGSAEAPRPTTAGSAPVTTTAGSAPVTAPADPGGRTPLPPTAYLPDDRQMPLGYAHVPSRDRVSSEAGGPDYYLKHYQSSSSMMVVGAVVTPSPAHARTVYGTAISGLLGQGWGFEAVGDGVSDGEEAALGIKAEDGILGLTLLHRVGPVVLSVSWAGLRGQEDLSTFAAVWQAMVAKARANPGNEQTIRASVGADDQIRLPD